MSDEASKKVAKRLRKTRLEHGLTQAALAKKAGLNTNSYAKIERGERKPTFETIEKLSKALGVTATDIVGF